MLGLLLAMRLPYFWLAYPLTGEELGWQLLASRIAEGHHPYTGLWTVESPLHLWVSALLSFLPGSSRAWGFVLSLLMTIMLWIIGAQRISKEEIFTQRNELLGFFWLSMASSLMEFLVFSPSLLGNFCLLLFYLFTISRSLIKRETYFFGGFLAGLALLADLDAWPLVLYSLLIVMATEGLSIRAITSMLFGFLMVCFLFGFYLWFIDGVYDFLKISPFLWTYQGYYDTISYTEGLKYLIPWLLLVGVAIFQVNIFRSFVTFQTRFVLRMTLFILGAILQLSLNGFSHFYQIIYLIFPSAYFLSQYALIIRRVKLAHLIIVLGLLWSSLSLFWPRNSVFQLPLDDLQAASKPYQQISGKRVWVLGEDRVHYLGNALGSKFFYWPATRQMFDQLDTYEEVDLVADAMKVPPEIIIDLEGYLPMLLERFPYLKGQFRLMPGESRVYYLSQPMPAKP